MSLLFSEGFDVYGASGVENNTQPVDHWTSASINSQGGLFVQPGRYTGSDSLGIMGGDKATTSLRKNLSSTLTTGGKMIFGFNFKANGGSLTQTEIYLSTSSSPASNTKIMRVSMSTNNDLWLWNNGTITDTGTNLTIGQWYHFEFVLDRSANTFACYLDGTNIRDGITFSNDVSWIQISNYYDGSIPPVSRYHLFDDLYVLDGNGSSANDRIGSTARIDTLLPSGATSSADWSGTNASISGIPPDDNTTITAAASGDTSVFTFTDTQSQNFADANAISIRARAADTDSAGATIQPVVNGTSPVNAGSAFDPGTSFDEFQVYLDTNPETSSKFTAAEINSLELGFKSN